MNNINKQESLYQKDTTENKNGREYKNAIQVIIGRLLDIQKEKIERISKTQSGEKIKSFHTKLREAGEKSIKDIYKK